MRGSRQWRTARGDRRGALAAYAFRPDAERRSEASDGARDSHVAGLGVPAVATGRLRRVRPGDSRKHRGGFSMTVGPMQYGTANNAGADTTRLTSSAPAQTVEVTNAARVAAA